MFDKATLSLGTIKVMSKVAQIVGSSQQGNARCAPVGCKLKYTLKMSHVRIVGSLPVSDLTIHPTGGDSFITQFFKCPEVDPGIPEKRGGRTPQ